MGDLKSYLDDHRDAFKISLQEYKTSSTMKNYAPNVAISNDILLLHQWAFQVSILSDYLFTQYGEKGKIVL